MPRPVESDGFSAYLDAWEAKIGAFLEIDKKAIESAAKSAGHDIARTSAEASESRVADLPFGVKDNIAVQGMRLTCGSKLLEGFRSPYSATAVNRLIALGSVPAGKTNMDEFGMGSSTDDSGYQKTNNPWDVSRVAGGSSGGSAAAVAAGIVPFALGSDTGGSVRQPANFCGVVGLKPTYGAVSRFGLVAYASSLETIGVIADSPARARSVFEAVRGIDPMDQTSVSYPCEARALSPQESRETGPGVIGVLSPAAVAKSLSATLNASTASGVDAISETTVREASGAAVLEPEVGRAFEESQAVLRSLGYRLVDVELPSLKYAVPAYYTIATAEASANLARFDGIRYGRRPAYSGNPDEMVDGTRSAGFGAEVKLRILLGTFVLRSGFQDRYYLRAQRIRTGIRKDFERAFSACDAILMPVFPTRAFGRGQAGLSNFAQKAADIFTCCANLAGLPALAFPTGVEGGLPVGVQLVGREFEEGFLLDVAEAYCGSKPMVRPAGYRPFWGQR